MPTKASAVKSEAAFNAGDSVDYARDLYRRSVHAIGVKRWQMASGLTLTTIYRCMRDPNDPEQDAAVRTEHEREDLLFDLLAADANNRPLLIEWEELKRRGFARRLRREIARGVTQDEIVVIAGRCAKEFGDAMQEALTAGDDANALHQATELEAVTRELVAALSARVDAQAAIPMRGRKAG